MIKLPAKIKAAIEICKAEGVRVGTCKKCSAYIGVFTTCITNEKVFVELESVTEPSYWGKGKYVPVQHKAHKHQRM